MLSKFGLQTKIPLAIIGCAVASGLSVAVLGSWAAGSRMADLSAQQLTLLARDRADELRNDLTAIADDLKVVAAAPTTVEAAERLSEAYKAIPGDPTAVLQKAYIADNPNPQGQRQKLDAGKTGSPYDSLHAAYHPWLRTLQGVRGYADVLLFDAEGNLVYTSAKADDFGGRFGSGKGSGATADLSALFQTTQKGAAGSVTVQDYKPYNADKGDPASFMATPIVAGGRTVGVLAYRLSVDRLNAILGAPSVAGDTTETLLVGADGLVRNDSRSAKDSVVRSMPFQSAAVTEALAQKTGVARAADGRGVVLDQVAVPFDFAGSRFAVVATRDAAESDAAIGSLRSLFLMFARLAVPIAGVVGLLLARSIGARFAEIVKAFKNLADGNLEKPALDDDRADEFGALARSFAVCRQMLEQGRILQAGDQATRAIEVRREAQLQEAVDQFRTNVANVISSVEAEIEGIRSASGVLTQVADGAAGEANSAREASSASAENVDAIATTVEQLSTSIREIAERAQRASDHVVLAGDIARKADKDVAGLADSAEKVGAIVDLIKDIAGQTNLLALNATIEAARAGEAGRGFAVVASEVKQLASQTSKATEDISRQIMSIQGATRDAVTSIRTIASTVSEIEALAGSIAAAVQEQDAATGEIFNSVATAADRSKLLARNVDGLTTAVSETNREAQQVMMVSYQLSAVASVLSSDVEDFINKVAVDVKERRLSHRYGSTMVSVAMPGGKTVPTRCIDISETGARIADVTGLDVGSAIGLLMPDGVKLACHVVWIENEMIGVKFDEPIGNAVFDYAVDTTSAAA